MSLQQSLGINAIKIFWTCFWIAPLKSLKFLIPEDSIHHAWEFVEDVYDRLFHIFYLVSSSFHLKASIKIFVTSQPIF